MHAFGEIVVSNALVVTVLALGVALLGRMWKNPAALHLLWLLVLVKFVTPPLFTVPLPLPASTPLATLHDSEQAPSEANRQSLPGSPDSFRYRGAEGTGGAESMPAIDNVGAPQLSTKRLVSLRDTESNAFGATLRHEMPWNLVLFGIWGIGFAVLASTRAWRIVGFRNLLQAAQPARAKRYGHGREHRSAA